MNSFRWLWILLLIGSTSFAVDGGSRFDFRQKAQKKEGSRWTLQEWLAQKERNRLMDLWLIMNAPSPYEFFLKGAYNSGQTTIDSVTASEKSYQSYSGGLGAYATIIGVEADYENNTQESFNDLSGSLNLRILGNAVQGTHLILKYGLRTRTTDDPSTGTSQRIGNQFAGGDLNLYLTRYFGLQGLYHHYLPSDDAALGTVSGTRTEAGVFIDFDFVRLFGNWYTDTQEMEKASVKSQVQHKGIQTGLKFFF